MPGGGGGWHKAAVSNCLPLAAPIGLSPLPILTAGGGGGVDPTYMAQNDPHVALIILTTHMWGENFW